MVKGNFLVLIDGVLKYYSDYNSIPMKFDNLIRAEFDYPEGPHTEEQHELISTYNDLLKDLMKRERK